MKLILIIVLELQLDVEIVALSGLDAPTTSAQVIKYSYFTAYNF